MALRAANSYIPVPLPPPSVARLQKDFSDFAGYGAHLQQLSAVFQDTARLNFSPRMSKQLNHIGSVLERSSVPFLIPLIIGDGADLYRDIRGICRLIFVKRGRGFRPKASHFFSGLNFFKKIVKVIKRLDKLSFIPAVLLVKGLSKPVKTACLVATLLLACYQLTLTVQKYQQKSHSRGGILLHQATAKKYRADHVLLLKISGLSLKILCCVAQGLLPKTPMTQLLQQSVYSSVMLKMSKAIA
jgi:hypothetical protein